MIIPDVAQETEMTGWLVAENGEKIPLGGLCRIGREQSNDIILNTAAASRHHGLIHKRDDEFWIVDLGGINGIEVNGKRVIQPMRLQPGDRIQLPKVAFNFWQAVMAVPPRTEKKEESAPAPSSIPVPEFVPLPRVEQRELLLTVETVALPEHVSSVEPKEPKQVIAPEPPPIPVPPAIPKEPEPVIETRLTPPPIPPMKLKEAEQEVETEILPAPERFVEEKEFSSPPPVPAPKPEGKSRNDRKKSNPAPAPTVRTPTIASTDPQNVSVMAKRSMYIGLASIFLPFLGSISAVFAIVLGHKALRIIKKSDGILPGRDEAAMGLYFGYITLALILTYSTLIYIFCFSSTSSRTAIANVPTIPTFPPAIEIPKTPNPPSPPPSTATTSSQSIPSPAPSTTTPSKPDAPSSPPSAVSTDNQNISNPPLPSEIPSTQNTPTTPSPVETPSASTTAQIQPLPGPAPSLSDPTVNGYVMKAPVSLREDPSIPDTTKTPPPSAPPTTEESVSLPAAPANASPVFSYEVQSKLRDGMLAQPMPADSADRSYLDAEAFNNCARILARPPEAKYADSVKDFLDDVKHRNPDPARLQILTAMYTNYLAALKNQ